MTSCHFHFLVYKDLLESKSVKWANFDPVAIK